jgi:fumarate reductase subunit C
MRTALAAPFPDASVWPARLDLLQSLSGLVLGLFMWFHMCFVSAILVSQDAAWIVARFFEGYFVLGRALPWLVSIFVAIVSILFMVHALLALRKFPADWQQYRVIVRHSRRMRHGDTALWLVQVATGFAMFFLAPVHLYTMLVHPELIGPFESADRVWSGMYWPLYLVLLFMVEIHGGVGLYRLAIKWGWLPASDTRRGRKRLTIAKWTLTAFFLLLGLASLAAYVKLGQEHASAAGERYVPSWMRGEARQ